MQTLLQDLRDGARMLAKQPSFTLIAIILMVVCALSCDAVAQSRTDLDIEDFLSTLQQAREKTTARDWSNAIPLWEKVVQLNPVTGEYWYQLGEARYKNNDFRGALPAYEQSLRLGFALPSSRVRDMARCHVMLGEKEQALATLERAFAMGYRRIELIRNDPAFQALRSEPRFQKLVATIDTGKMSRDEGWRYDLQLLAREVKRLRYQPFRSISEPEFDAAVKKIHDTIPRLTEMQITIEMLRLLARVRDGHTTIYAMAERPELRRNLAIDFAIFEEGLFITAADERYENLLGARVLKFGERTVAEVLAAIDTTVHRDHERAVLVMGPLRMRNPSFLHGLGLIASADQVALTIADAQGHERVVKLKADSDIPSRRLWDGLPPGWKSFQQTLGGQPPLYLKNQYADYWFEFMPDAKTVYCQFNRVRNNEHESLAAFCERLFKFINENSVEKLVLDMRWNNGGDTTIVQPLLHGLIRNDKINQRGKLFVITGRRTYSAGQNTATYIERHTSAIFVGEPTGSSPNFIGEDNAFELPYSKLILSVSDLYWQSSMPDDHRPWIAPLLYTPPTFAALRANRDLALEAILAYRN
jgi:tetratricopeptide (TPR) repeat protein